MMSASTLGVGSVFLVLAALGGLARWWAARWNSGWPWGTIAANLAACFALGLTTSLTGWWVDPVRVGLLGALSTWSTVAQETAAALRAGRPATAFGYVSSTVAGGVALAWFGLALGS